MHSASLFGDATFIAIKRVTKLAGNNYNSYMKKSLSTSSPDKSKKKKPRAPYLGDFEFISMQIVKGKEYRCKIEGGKKLETCFCIGSNNAFKSEQRQDNHEQTYTLVQQHYKDKLDLDNTSNNNIESSYVASTLFIVPPRKKPRESEHQSR